jgi:hypothetical protein
VAGYSGWLLWPVFARATSTQTEQKYPSRCFWLFNKTPPCSARLIGYGRTFDQSTAHGGASKRITGQFQITIRRHSSDLRGPKSHGTSLLTRDGVRCRQFKATPGSAARRCSGLRDTKAQELWCKLFRSEQFGLKQFRYKRSVGRPNKTIGRQQRLTDGTVIAFMVRVDRRDINLRRNNHSAAFAATLVTARRS